ncbi:hypothetical protein ACFO4O_16580 [Glaciecola siphonariae]|uniref:Uncharacterized protein n=1 Tax=Glaciecola siphonariae TaxID=521012 RepID=A0ABV9M1I8_9ALTE
MSLSRNLIVLAVLTAAPFTHSQEEESGSTDCVEVVDGKANTAACLIVIDRPGQPGKPPKKPTLPGEPYNPPKTPPPQKVCPPARIVSLYEVNEILYAQLEGKGWFAVTSSGQAQFAEDFLILKRAKERNEAVELIYSGEQAQDENICSRPSTVTLPIGVNTIIETK